MLKIILFLNFFINLISHAEELKNSNIDLAKKSFIDSEGDKIIVLDLEARKLLQSTKEIKAIDLYDSDEIKKNNTKNENGK